VGSLKADAIFDTGAQVTTMSVAFYKRLGCPTLLNVPASASGADGTGLRLIGAVSMELAIGTRKFPFRAWVIEGLRTDVLVGLDFMRQFPTKVDVAEGKISICGQSIPVSPRGWGSDKERRGLAITVRFMQTVEIPAGHGREIPVKVFGGSKPTDVKMLEFIPEQIGDQVYAAYGIVDAAQDLFMVRVANLGTGSVTLEEGCVVGHLEDARSVTWVQSLLVENEVGLSAVGNANDGRVDTCFGTGKNLMQAPIGVGVLERMGSGRVPLD
jgi:hypothetical protein